MANSFDYKTLSVFIEGVVNPKIRAVSLGISTSISFLRSLVAQAKTSADAAKADADATRNIWNSFLSTYVGIKAEDPTKSDNNGALKVGSFYVRSTDKRLRVLTGFTNGVPVWENPVVEGSASSIRAVGDVRYLMLSNETNQTVSGPVTFSGSIEVPAGDWNSNRATRAVDVRDRLDMYVPRGAIMAYFGVSAPQGWAFCDGGTYNRTDGQGTIATPDLRGRVIMGVSGTYGFATPYGADVNTVNTADSGSNITLNYQLNSNYAGGGTQTAVAGGRNGSPPSIDNPTHAHSVTMNVIQPSMALTYIMKI